VCDLRGAVPACVVVAAFALATACAAPVAAQNATVRRAAAAPARVAEASQPPSQPTSQPAPEPMVAAADCTLVGRDDAARVLGYPVDAPDETSRSAGICFFSSRAISQDGSVTYALVTAANLSQRRAFAATQLRRCAGVAETAPNAGICKTYADVALAPNLDAYFRARTAGADTAAAVPGLGDAAVAAPDALYVRRGETMFEVVVRRGDTLDVERETALAKLLLQRVVAAPERQLHLKVRKKLPH